MCVWAHAGGQRQVWVLLVHLLLCENEILPDHTVYVFIPATQLLNLLVTLSQTWSKGKNRISLCITEIDKWLKM